MTGLPAALSALALASTASVADSEIAETRAETLVDMCSILSLGDDPPTGPGPADTWQGTGSGAPGKPALTWWSGQAAIDAEAATDGWYALLTNLDATETAAAVLLRYKAQEAVERRYGNLK